MDDINPPPSIVAPNKKPSPPKVAAQFVGFSKTHFHRYFFPEDGLGDFLLLLSKFSNFLPAS